MGRKKIRRNPLAPFEKGVKERSANHVVVEDK
jgi:hypothetical protein